MTSLKKLAAARPHSAGHVEAPDPDIIMRRLATSERTMTPAMHQQARSIQCPANNRMSAALASSNGASATAVPGGEEGSKEVA